MTYFLEDAPQQPMAPRGPDQLLSTWMQGVGASFYQMLRDTNANSQRQMEVKNEGYATAAPAAERLGIDTIYEKYKDSVVSMDFLPQKPKTTDELFSMLGPNAPQMVLDMAREQAKANPDAWKDLDLSEEGIQARVTEKRVKEDSEEQQILDLLPNGRGLAEFVGGAAGMIADVRQLPFLAFGGGEGSLLRIIGREAFLNTAAEAVTLPSQFETAKELGKPDPNVPSHLIQAAVGGAALGGALPALGRALEYFRGRSKTPQIIGRNPEHSNIVVTAAEQAIAAGEDPVAAATRAIQELPAEPPPRRPGLIIESRLDPVQGQTPEPLPDPVIIGQAEAAIADAESAFANDFPEMRHKNPLAKKIQSMGGIQASRINPATGAREATQAAQELASMGVTTKTHPFLFRNKGMADLDNIPAADHLGLAEVLKVDQATGYFDRQDMLSALARELTTGKKTAMTGEIAARMAEIEHNAGIDPNVSPAKDFASGLESPTGWFVQKGAYDMFPDGDVMLRNSFEKYLGDVWPGVRFTDAERAEMLHELQTRGGDAEYLVSRTLERDLEFAELPKAEAEKYDWIPGFDEPTAQGVSRTGGESAGGPEQVATATRGGAEGRSGGAIVEPTAAGDQFVAPGIEPVSQRQRLEARQETPMRGGARPMDDGLFDMGARQQMDMFSDPASAEARVILDSMTNDLKSEIGMTSKPNAKPDPDNPKYLDTRGSGIRYHGSRKANLDNGVHDGAYSTLNIYGQGFYTTDAAAVAAGYNKGGGFYVITEKNHINALDMEGPIPNWLLDDLHGNELVDSALNDGDIRPVTIRQLYDEIRDASRSLYVPADEVQGIFETFERKVLKQGFNALDHVGGGNTGKAPHKVRIYLEPWKDISVERSAPPTAPSTTPANDFLIDMGDGKGERMASTVLDDLDKGDAAAARFDLCGRGPA